MVEEVRLKADRTAALNKAEHDLTSSPTRRAKPIDRRRLIKRLEALVARQVDQLERGEMEQGPDKEVALLGNLARTLEKLIDLDDKQVERQSKPSQNSEMARVRKRLSERIRQLNLLSE